MQNIIMIIINKKLKLAANISILLLDGCGHIMNIYIRYIKVY